MDATLTITAVTNFALAGESLVFGALTLQTAKSRYSARWYFGLVLLFLGAAALAGGIDHGIIETRHWPRYAIQRSTWILLACATFCLLMTAAKQFFPARWHPAIAAVAVLQLLVDALVVLRVDSFLDVILNYAPVMLLFLVLNVMRPQGSRQMIAGLLLQIAASAIQALGIDSFAPLDHNGLYHAVSTLAVVFLYRGGQQLRTMSPGHGVS